MNDLQDTVRLAVRVPEELRRAVKRRAIDQGATVENWVARVLRAELAAVTTSEGNNDAVPRRS